MRCYIHWGSLWWGRHNSRGSLDNIKGAMEVFRTLLDGEGRAKVVLKEGIWKNPVKVLYIFLGKILFLSHVADDLRKWVEEDLLQLHILMHSCPSAVLPVTNSCITEGGHTTFHVQKSFHRIFISKGHEMILVARAWCWKTQVPGLQLVGFVF